MKQNRILRINIFKNCVCMLNMCVYVCCIYMLVFVISICWSVYVVCIYSVCVCGVYMLVSVNVYKVGVV